MTYYFSGYGERLTIAAAKRLVRDGEVEMLCLFDEDPRGNTEAYPVWIVESGPRGGVQVNKG